MTFNVIFCSHQGFKGRKKKSSPTLNTKATCLQKEVVLNRTRSQRLTTVQWINTPSVTSITEDRKKGYSWLLYRHNEYWDIWFFYIYKYQMGLFVFLIFVVRVRVCLELVHSCSFKCCGRQTNVFHCWGRKK